MPVTFGAKKNPSYRSCKCPIVAPSSVQPGAVNCNLAFSTKSFLPTIYPPVLARPPPAFLIKDPAIKSAPYSVGSYFSANSP